MNLLTSFHCLFSKKFGSYLAVYIAAALWMEANMASFAGGEALLAWESLLSTMSFCDMSTLFLVDVVLEVHAVLSFLVFFYLIASFDLCLLLVFVFQCASHT